MRTGLLLAAALALGGCSRIVVLHDPLTPVERCDLGVVYEGRGDLPAAEREYRRALRVSPGLARASVNLGNLSAARERWPEAERWYRRALRSDPGSLDARNNLAMALLRQGQGLEEAEWLARSAVALAGAPDRADADVREARATLASVRAARDSMWRRGGP